MLKYKDSLPYFKSLKDSSHVFREFEYTKNYTKIPQAVINKKGNTYYAMVVQ